MMNLTINKISKAFLFCSLLAYIPNDAIGQSNEMNQANNKKSFSDGLFITASFGYNSYFGDLTAKESENILPFNNESQPAFGLGIHKELFGFFELGLKGLIGKVQEVNSGKRISTNNIYSFNSNIKEFGLNSNINLVNLLRKSHENKFAFLVSVGYGITSYNPETKVLFPNGSESEFPANVNSNPGKSTSGTLSFGLGMRYKINNNWAVGVESSLYNLSNDDLDAWEGNSSFNDRYSFMALNINYFISKKSNSKSEKDKMNKLVEQVQPVEKVIKEDVTKKEELVQEVKKEIVEDVKEEKEEKEEVAEKIVETIPLIKEKEVVPNKDVLKKLSLEDFKNDIIYFEINSNKSSSSIMNQIESIAKKMQKHSTAKIMLAGYTDKTGTAAKNQILSEQRAEWVKSILVSKYNINSSRINTIGKGQQGPNQESDQKNRKVEVIRVF